MLCWYSIVSFLANIWVTSLKPFYRKARQRFTQIFTIENNFGATLWAEPISESLKIVFFAILQFSEWQVESKFSESRVKPLKLCKSIFCHKKYFTKRFWRYYVLQKGCSECLKRLILTTLSNFELRNRNCFLVKRGKALFQIFFLGNILKNSFSLTFDLLRFYKDFWIYWNYGIFKLNI